jgi:hypothetical protein
VNELFPILHRERLIVPGDIDEPWRVGALHLFETPLGARVRLDDESGALLHVEDRDERPGAAGIEGGDEVLHRIDDTARPRDGRGGPGDERDRAADDGEDWEDGADSSQRPKVFRRQSGSTVN